MIVTEQYALAQMADRLPDVRRVLVLAPHPDDEIFGCGGTLALLREAGAAISVVVVTDGAQGGTGDADRLGLQRAEESRRAAETLGLAPPAFWALPDRSLAADTSLAARIAETLVENAPELILLPAPTEIHPDHQALALAGIEALRRTGLRAWLAFYEISQLLPAPNLVLDTSRVADLKRQAMACFASQLDEQPYGERIEGLNRYRAYHLGPHAASAEAFLLAASQDLSGGVPALFEWPFRYRHDIARKDEQLARQDDRIAGLEQRLDASQRAVTALEQDKVGLESSLRDLSAEIDALERTREHLQSEIQALLQSTSWRITAPLRLIVTRVGQLRRALRALPAAVGNAGGMRATVFKLVRILRREGIGGLIVRLKMLSRWTEAGAPPPAGNPADPRPLVVPYYIDPRLDETCVELTDTPSVALHLHLFYPDMLERFSVRLAAVPLAFDLYVSIPEQTDVGDIQTRLRAALPNAGRIVVETVPNRGRDIAPLIVQFGRRLSRYGIVGHLHTKKSPHNPGLANWCEEILDLLLGEPGNRGSRVMHIIHLLLGPASVVYPEGNARIIKDRSGWAGNYGLARDLLQRYTRHAIDDYPVIEFPEGAMFWARGCALQELLALPLDYADFPPEPLPADGTLAHAIERLLLVFVASGGGTPYRLHRGDSIPDYRHYESQRDYSGTIACPDIKVLSYYLPQFHPIPENDRWHGKGFTEWTKVRAANPLFRGHYQQHIPHPDIGCYLLDTPATLRRQAEQMRRAGVHGQVFYHYWFAGKLILEAPARMLLDNPDIRMPYCFCWANENWTRRWDGNEQEVLLRQDYSADDARAFIRYLLPFFRDPRYLRIENRPVLFTYRPTSLPADGLYPAVWKEECAAAGLPPPYLVAVLTRGATDPREFGMDAGVERVLHDWTGGAVPDIKTQLQPYGPLRGSVLDYDAVKAHYQRPSRPRGYTYFRSLVPNWDNTARYGPDAYLLHGSTPVAFQEWLEHIVAAARRELPADRRFVLVNAWNEWAEGAHLEPDSRYGYAYLNAIGRALSGMPYGAEPRQPVPAGQLVIHLAVPPYLRDQLALDADLRRRFLQGLERAGTLRDARRLTTDAIELLPSLPNLVAGEAAAADLILEIRRLALFAPTVIDELAALAIDSPEAAIIPNRYDAAPLPAGVLRNGAVPAGEAHDAPLLLMRPRQCAEGFRTIRMAPAAWCHLTAPTTRADKAMPAVTSIIRFHAGADLGQLERALYCLAAMRDCRVTPLLALQDLDAAQQAAVERLLAAVPWPAGIVPRWQTYATPDGKGDLRGVMLKSSLCRVETRYAAFLDYDDLLLPHAYAWLAERIVRTGKAVSFGRVYATTCDAATGRLLERRRTYEYGYSYDDFLRLNHAPLHSFLLDAGQFDFAALACPDDQRYLEDYYLTLQLFTRDNADWASLAENCYIGDYVHCLDRSQTLAIADGQARRAVLDSPDYRRCEARVQALKARLAEQG